jgi:O-methyltransferase involved in polyketide biosynthesis
MHLGLGIPAYLRLVPLDFESGDAWWERLAAAGFASGRPAVVASTGVAMYLTREANVTTLRRIVQHVSAATLAERYFARRTDGLRPPMNAEELLVATTFAE